MQDKPDPEEEHMADPDKTPKVPRYSYDLIDQLDADIIAPILPVTLGSWRAMNESELRAAAFMAGQRALVDLLLTWRTEVEQEVKDAISDDRMADGSDDEEDFPFGTVLGPDGEEHKTVASTYVAARLVPEVSGDRDEPEYVPTVTTHEEKDEEGNLIEVVEVE